MISAEFIDNDEIFRSVANKAIVINDISLKNNEDYETLKDKLHMLYNDTSANLLPRCDCGNLEGEYYKSLICDNCGSEVISPFDDLRPVIWFKADKSIGKFIATDFWYIVRMELGKTVDIFRWICDKRFNIQKPTKVALKLMHIIQGIPGFKRNYKWLVSNLEKILIVLSETTKSNGIREILSLFRSNKDRILCEYLPILNKRMFVVEKVGQVKYMNLTLNDVNDVILMYNKNINSEDERVRDLAMGRTNYALVNIYGDLLVTYVKGKKGIPRKLIDGFRSFFTVRGVITPIVRKHKYDELELPWSQAVVLFRPFILNILYNKYNYSYNEITKKLNKAVTTFDREISEIFDYLLNKSNGYGIPVTFQRNPSLLNGSMLSLRITVIKRDLTDPTISMSILVAKLPNADFDGDEMNLQLLIDDYLYNLMKVLEPAASVANMASPGGISGRLTLTDPVIATISNFISTQRRTARLKLKGHK